MVKLEGLAEELRKECTRRHRADVNIGRNGIHTNLVNEVKRVLEAQGIAKLRVLRNARNIVSDDDVASLAKAVDAIVADSRGYTYILIARKILKSSSRIDSERLRS